MERSCKVCVTDTTSYSGPWLVKRLLEKGYTVHATFKDLKDESENVTILKSFPHAEERLVLFEVDIYNPDEFEPAIQGCEFVFHVDPPSKDHENEFGSQYMNTVEAAIARSRSIAMCCKRAGTVRRLIFSSMVLAASPLKDDGSAGFKDFVDETCWTPLIDSYAYLYHHDFYKVYTYSKTLSEKELLSYGNSGGMEVVTLPCGLIVGDSLQSSTPNSVALCISMLTENALRYRSLKFFEEFLGKIPLVHVDDACEAHIFCMENPSINGRFLCASSFVSSQEIANYYLLHYPEFQVKKEYLQGPKREVKWASTKLNVKGFVYKYDTKMILDVCIKCARMMGDL